MIVRRKAGPWTELDSILTALRSRTEPLLTKPAGNEPFHVMMSRTPLFTNWPPTDNCALPSRRTVAWLVTLPTTARSPPVLTMTWPVTTSNAPTDSTEEGPMYRLPEPVLFSVPVLTTFVTSVASPPVTQISEGLAVSSITAVAP